ncbi:hypothetical protein SprV_0501847800 [Sparganum proliferum]
MSTPASALLTGPAVISTAGACRPQCVSLPPLSTTDDCALDTETEANMQQSMELFALGRANFEPTINMGKTVVTHQLSPNAAYSAPRIHVSGNQLKTVDDIAYLGGTLSQCVKIDDAGLTGSSKSAKLLAIYRTPHGTATVCTLTQN